MTFKNKKKEIFEQKVIVASFRNLLRYVFLNGFKSYEICVYTNYLSKSNQRAHGFLI